MKKLIISTLLVSGISTALANDGTPSYNYVEASYLTSSGDIDVDGFGLAGSLELSDNFFMEIDYQPLNAEVSVFGFSADVDFTRTALGVGYKSEFGESSSWYLSYARNQVDIEGAGNTYVNAARIGVRSMMNEDLELNASYVNYDGDGSSSDAFQVGLAYSFSDDFQFILENENDSGDNTSLIGLRMTF